MICRGRAFSHARVSFPDLTESSILTIISRPIQGFSSINGKFTNYSPMSIDYGFSVCYNYTSLKMELPL